MNQPVENPGWLRLGETSGNDFTVVICGLCRSGTTATASIVEKCLPLLYDREGNREHIQLVKSIYGQDWGRVDSIVSQQPSRWSFKMPHAWRFSAVFGMLDNPRLIIPFRDPLAISWRDALALQIEPIESLRLAIETQRELMEFIDASRYPLLLISYEKLLQFPERLTKVIAEFCESPVPTVTLSPENPLYATVAGGDACGSS